MPNLIQKIFEHKLKIIVSLIVIIFFLFWETILGFYINLFNIIRPQSGNYWENYKISIKVDSTKYELYEVEKLRKLANSNEINYLKDFYHLIQELGHLKISRRQFLDFYLSLPDEIKIKEFSVYEFLSFFFNPELDSILIEKKADKIIFFYLKSNDESISENFSSIMTNNLKNLKSEPVIISDMEHWALVYDSVLINNAKKINSHYFFQFIYEHYKKTKQKIILDEHFLLEWLNNPIDFYLIENDSARVFDLLALIDNTTTQMIWKQELSKKAYTSIKKQQTFEEIRE